MPPLTPVFQSAAAPPSLILAGAGEALGEGETAGAGQAAAGEKTTGKAAGAQDVATLDLAFKETPQQSMISRMIKLIDSNPHAAKLFGELALAEGQLLPHHIDIIENKLKEAQFRIDDLSPTQRLRGALGLSFDGPANGLPQPEQIAAVAPRFQPQSAPSPFAAPAPGRTN